MIFFFTSKTPRLRVVYYFYFNVLVIYEVHEACKVVSDLPIIFLVLLGCSVYTTKLVYTHTHSVTKYFNFMFCALLAKCKKVFQTLTVMFVLFTLQNMSRSVFRDISLPHLMSDSNKRMENLPLLCSTTDI